jgi:hypothetical protein
MCTQTAILVANQVAFTNSLIGIFKFLGAGIIRIIKRASKDPVSENKFLKNQLSLNFDP